MTNAVKQRLSQLRALLDTLDQRREKANGEHTADLQEKIYAIELAIAQRESLVDTTELERHKLGDARSVLKTLSRIFLP